MCNYTAGAGTATGTDAGAHLGLVVHWRSSQAPCGLAPIKTPAERPYPLLLPSVNPVSTRLPLHHMPTMFVVNVLCLSPSFVVARWETQGYFRPDPEAPGPAFTIPMPPPNVTGRLHMGHAMFVTLQVGPGPRSAPLHGGVQAQLGAVSPRPWPARP